MKFVNRHTLTLIGALTMVSAHNTATAGNLYVEAQGTEMEYEIDYANGTETYEVDPAVVKIGYAGEPVNGYSGGVELHLIGDSDDSIIDPFGVPFRTEIDTSFALHGKYGYQGERFGLYGTIGLILLDTTYTSLNTLTSDTDDVLLVGGSVGVSFRLVGSLRLTADYSFASGEAAYPTFITGNGEADVNFSGFGVGLNYQF